MVGQIGTLQAGAWGDAVVFDLEEGRFEYWDSHQQVRVGRQRLVPRVVVRAGKVYRDAAHHA
jgi:predicted amidohydrolase